MPIFSPKCLDYSSLAIQFRSSPLILFSTDYIAANLIKDVVVVAEAFGVVAKPFVLIVVPLLIQACFTLRCHLFVKLVALCTPTL